MSPEQSYIENIDFFSMGTNIDLFGNTVLTELCSVNKQKYFQFGPDTYIYNYIYIYKYQYLI